MVKSRPVLIRSELVSPTEYLIVCKGWPKEGLTDTTQIIESAKEAARFNAQLIAKQRFIPSFDVITNGEARNIRIEGDYAVVEYYVVGENIESQLRK